MALDRQTVQLPFIGGLDTKTDAKHAPAAKLLTLENGTFSSPGVIKKRYGHTALSTTLSAATGLHAFGDELLVTQRDGVLCSFRDSNDTMPQVGTVSGVNLGFDRILATDGLGYVSFDAAVNLTTGVTCYVYRGATSSAAPNEGTVYYSIVDTSTGAFIQKNVQIVAGIEYSPRVVVLNNYFLVFAEMASNTEVKAYSIDTTGAMTAAVDRSATLGTGAGGLYSGWDVCECAGYVSFVYASLSTRFVSSNITEAGGTFSVSNLNSPAVTATSVYAVCAGASDASSVVIYKDGSGVYAIKRITSSWVQGPHSLGFTVGNWGTGALDVGGVVHVWTSATNASAREYVQQGTVNMATGAVTGPTTVRANCSLASRPFTISGSKVYGWVCTRSTVQPTYVLCESAGLLHGVAGYEYATPGASTVGSTGIRVPQVRAVATGQYAVPLGMYFDNGAEFGDSATWATIAATLQKGAVDLRMDASTTTLGMSVNAGRHAFFSGGVLKSFDGVTCSEQGFISRPEDITGTPSPAVASPAFTYAYQVVYEWTDAAGQRHYSAPSDALSVSTDYAIGGATGGSPSTQQVTVTSQACLYSDKTNVRAALYRTSASGEIYYRVADTLADTSAYDTYFRVSFVDTTTDAVLEARPQIYTMGSEAATWAPGATGAICEYKGRLVAVSAEYPDVAFISKPVGFVEAGAAGVPVEFSQATEQFQIPVDQAGGPITALGVMDSNLIALKRAKVFVLGGEGPDAKGNNSTLSAPVQLAVEVGCPYPKSVVLTPSGLMFQSLKGVYLLDRSLSAQYVGAPVEGLVGTATVRAAMVTPRSYQVRLAMSSGVWLVWDYVMNQWSTFTGLDSVGLAIWGDEACHVTLAGDLYREDRTVYTDGGSFVQLHVVTAWLQLAGLQGFQRVNHAALLAEGSPSHTISVRLYTDFKAASDQKVVFLPSTDTPVMQRRVHLKNQKCEAVKLDITDVSVSGTDGGLSLSGLSFEIGVKKGLIKLGPARSY